MNGQQMIKAGLIKPVSEDTYITDDNRTIHSTYIGRRKVTLRWKVDNIDFLYRNLYEAYHDLKY